VALEKTADPGEAPTGEVSQNVSAVPRGRTGAVRPVTGQRGPGEAGTGVVEVVEKAANEPAPAESSSEPKSQETPQSAEEKRPGRRSSAKPGGPKAGDEKRMFDSPKDAPISELPADVDPSGVIDLKRSLAAGRWPPPGTVRVEEMLNYFPYGYAAPVAPADFAPAMETAEAPWDPSHRLVRVALKAREVLPPARAAANLVLLVDTSGSMAAPNRLPLVKEAARLLLARLRPDDRVGLVTYAGESRLTLVPTPVAETRKILDALGRLEARGTTNGGAGLELAYDLARAHTVPDGVNGVILCTDGDFNVGATSVDELTRLIDQQAKSGVQLSIFGFGRNGRIDPRLEAMAAHGRGSSGYVNTRREAEQVLTAQLNGLFEPVATDVKVEVAFNPAKVESYHLLGYEDGPGALPDRAAVDRQSGLVLPGQTLTALYEVVMAKGAAAEADLLKLRVSYANPQAAVRRQVEFPLRDHPAAFAQASLDFKFAAAVAAFGLVLQGAPDHGVVSLDQVEAWGRECLGDDTGGYRSEFLSLVAQAKAARL
jgi:Ca-activated chloride channel family protein